MEDMLKQILEQLTRIADYYDAKGKREVNKELKVIKELRSAKRKSAKKRGPNHVNSVNKVKNDKSL
tara:strand:- start:2065 stop:2262 length:198 start_codon:yes stop_codon:yes gene_type:complete